MIFQRFTININVALLNINCETISPSVNYIASQQIFTASVVKSDINLDNAQ